ncbi:UDP-2,4-diacetamido-2,4,6-trideoxy-beta-L-altropyranose hydrolase [Sulfurospirillum diekertiae]|uniref:UDP-2,4-diacetamido-2,4, 6-trideoxy-beta-L-altropyranose hydrolase n=1 Tax=Sulfurospirillum diekertiae TaxID=1854492 RepID=A0A6G9VSK7_9BACT|nr:UDP-2,4-diacetamido-2,4,6-trideoxy-beta-L-altropyranose hydrolase [Sulfurospirillum diekertiae]QIR75950.1 UDP-2,4-diacetamido-2,4,6-trideoxy-beta-L-altropyranose hydrolase [Sulfurospirillum diekertiae]QIR78592.1 UDP-2,4-diacetamido-2,4,6-trideoxy-beta-L-altropyranose hydrolase [Sulfurospirillum diekertiae]
MKTLIRADSSSTIGLGHIMRDLVLAKSFEGEVIFACQNLEGNIIASIPYEVKILRSNDVDELIALIKSLHVKRLVIDHYGIDAPFEQKVKEATGVKILSFDDTYQVHHCDILLNHNLSADAARYTHLVPKTCELRCGSAYTLIREEFKLEKEKSCEKIYDVFVAMGGTDTSNITLKILKALPKILNICVLTTTANAHLPELQNYVTCNPNIALHVNSNEVAKLLHQSRLAIVTPSVMVHEVLFMEVPFIAIKVARNQDDMYQYLKNNGFHILEKVKNVDLVNFLIQELFHNNKHSLDY